MRAALLALVCACGARTELGGIIEVDASHIVDASIDHRDASVIDAPSDVVTDVNVADVPPPPCDFGVAVEDVFGSTVTWGSVPPGHYRVTYVDGCMKYSSGQAWTVNAYANGPDTLYVVTTGNQIIAPAPGTVGFVQGQGGFTSFDDCVNTNLANDAPLEFDFAGGLLALHLEDSPYTDNVAGVNGRSPSYRLSSCP